MKKILFIDRDGTIIKEHPPTYQIDSLEKVNFYPRVIFFLTKIVHDLDYDLVMVTNQDGLGTEKFPEKNFWPIHNHILKILKTEGINFSSVHIDRTIPEENSSTRKPGTDMLNIYLKNPDYNIEHSFVIGDRITDILLAKNLGCKSIWINEDDKEKEFSIKKNSLKEVIVLKTDNWKKIYEYLKYVSNKRFIHRRKTLETDVKITIQLYGGEGKSEIQTGLGFFDHLLEQMAFHSGIDMNIHTKGDLKVDEHHTIEDTAITLGEVFHRSIDKRGIERYGFFSVPMDDCLATVALDLGGRSELSWKAKFLREKIGKVPTDMFIHFFKSFSFHAKCNLYIKAIGENDHHKIESIFKAFSRALKMAIQRRINNNKLPSSKGLL
ncbi:MAG: bifunctional histidinol-phosphatase/imidazoleglycerol-phosphate dehydratase HisB [Flavobacteriales bacterium]|jgi:imidazoleglycerol-phosphate dehydratase/histidinol-phosphatase|uniref:bifunctional histidinol-phosphatase/imidazoleglycerol-phosphate dehydratase HisB n=1 Tax=Blattabacterium sp. (Mastotermes darwiniensis) TaxID=39768 RepID=UPI000231DFC4|nr:bifunctional histidinol-phosphatase/imidazoleglycerol-phosphate dehydratase HisB [Blattabacterium sp. (Mastotermes darwiniensis)]AER40476.1 imidazole glycerol-phosphate dehydratase/histidinol phosphatase [Blattabacterium sp. (Mastotermes darwiniensis) str. MADAR]MDR1805008.1 bifunctional histidinol-phosphatase/imidazoleglycerol-phosphate dehydratase HisB [Flavobacteriales bacterium]